MSAAGHGSKTWRLFRKAFAFLKPLVRSVEDLAQGEPRGIESRVDGPVDRRRPQAQPGAPDVYELILAGDLRVRAEPPGEARARLELSGPVDAGYSSFASKPPAAGVFTNGLERGQRAPPRR